MMGCRSRRVVARRAWISAETDVCRKRLGADALGLLLGEKARLAVADAACNVHGLGNLDVDVTADGSELHWSVGWLGEFISHISRAGLLAIDEDLDLAIRRG
jgi:hypothetical protein